MGPDIKELLQQPGWEEALYYYDSTGGYIHEDNPWKFLGRFLGAVDTGKPIYLAKIDQKPGFEGYIMIPTGGTTGGLKLAIHTWENIVSSVKRTCNKININKIDSVCLLPLNHVSGLMAALRAFITGGSLRFQPEGQGGYLSIVPTQLKRYLKGNFTWLKDLDGIFVGGAKSDEKLLETARKEGLNVMDVYGSTETMAMAVMDGEPMPGVEARIKNSRVQLKTDSLFYGYYPNKPQKSDWWEMGDLGYFEDNKLKITGRADQLIITGGEKVDPEKVERVILESGLVESVQVKGEPDPEWGSRVVAHCEGGWSEEALRQYCKERLLGYEVPKEFLA